MPENASLALPGDLESAVEDALKELPTSQWVSAGRTLSARYRAERRDGEPPLARGNIEALGYAAFIMPATYAQIRGAALAAIERVPSWSPVSLLDLGSGPGTALWAAVESWPSLRLLTAWEREPAFIALGRRLAAAGRHPVLSAVRWERVALESVSRLQTAKHDLIVLGHVLTELSESARRRVLAYAWDHCDGLVLIVEPGTSSAFPIVRSAREYLLSLGASTLAPCAHDDRCPLAGDWCHFPRHLIRPSFQRRAKAGSAGWELSKYAYAAMARFAPERPIWARLIHQPHPHKQHVELTVSSRAGVETLRVPKTDREAYRQARSLGWGDVLDRRPDRAEHPSAGDREPQT